ncbi:exodeoxyribonuclease VII large subunit [Marinitoga hydrogenitolerans DSM 16785]|uniref:Exodeoxyribonuclease 7 large subunit n=1 Tax=Marinitoga hydrogenitolerans (strain DSM 16785 / JCM 12826 / AT1271) TaxID=1122195 RepID=A0A1M4U701_MARH1|nr:exodeoxyribonuclease VII large subunit [Marinitoga hydrogenitolerans]SHE52367.1 exodeoxyribonuclease VII large subunit [Marinitoga hydrogenitolerans DSM 16785]
MKKFKSLLELINWISLELEKTNLFDDTVVFEGDISRAKISSAGDLFIEVSQRNEKGKTFKINVFLSRYYIKTLIDNLGLKNIKELENKSWNFLGKISFWPTTSTFAIRLQSLFPLGDSKLEKRRKEIIKRLKIKGLLRERENKLESLQPIRKIAVISSETAAGYGDFIKNINKLKNPPLIHLYPSSMQGVEVPINVSKALKRIIESKINYDVIALIRGGGSQSDLMYFDDYNLAENIAWVSNNKIPVLTGIGHEQDITIPDYVSYMRFSTPTEVARSIVNQIEVFNNQINDNFQNIIYSINNIFLHAEFYTKNILNNLSVLIDQFFEEEKNKMNVYHNSLTFFERILENSESFISKELNSFDFISKYINNEINIIKNDNYNIEKTIRNLFEVYESNLLKKLNDYYLEITKNSPFSSFLSGGAVLVQNSEVIDSVYKLDKKKNLEIKLRDGEVESIIKEVKYYKEEMK